MSFTIRNYHAAASASNAETPLLSGASGATVVKSLEVINAGASSCNVEIIRKDGGTAYATVPVEMKPNDYLILWEGFFVVPSGHTLSFRSNSTLCTVVANAVERT